MRYTIPMSLPLVTAAVALMDPVLTTDPAYLHKYAYALNRSAMVADRLNNPVMATRWRARAYYLRTLAR